MAVEKVRIDSVEYLLGQFSWGIATEIQEKSFTVDADFQEGKKKNIVPKVRTNMAVYMILVVVNSLRDWNFRGVDSEGNIKREGDILPINEENVRSLPNKHGSTLYTIATKLNSLEEEDEKN